MKKNDILILALAGLIGWLLIRDKTTAGMVKSHGDGQWHYNDNGVSIDPAGNWFRNGVLIWSPYAHAQE